MSVSIGIGLAFVAMLCWGIGDFLIQRSTRKIGDFETLLAITGAGAVILLPFVWRDIGGLFNGGFDVKILLVGSFILFAAALLEFEALKRGKISVIEPIWSLEIPTSVFLAYTILSEKLSGTQLLIIFSLVVGLFLVSYRGKVLSRSFFPRTRCPYRAPRRGGHGLGQLLCRLGSAAYRPASYQLRL